MDRKNKLIKGLNIVFWIFLVLTVVFAFKEYQYLTASAPSSGNWELDTSNAPDNSYLYNWINYINLALVGLSATLTAATYLIKKLMDDNIS